MPTLQKLEELVIAVTSTVVEGTFSGGFVYVSGPTAGSPGSGQQGIRTPLRAIVAPFAPMVDYASGAVLTSLSGAQVPVIAQVVDYSGNTARIRLIQAGTSGGGFDQPGMSGIPLGLRPVASGATTSGIRLNIAFLGA